MCIRVHLLNIQGTPDYRLPTCSRGLKVVLKAKNISISKLYFPKVSKLNNYNIYDWKFFPFATGVQDTGGAP